MNTKKILIIGLMIISLTITLMSLTNLGISKATAESPDVSQDVGADAEFITYLPAVIRDDLPQVESVFGVDVGTIYPSGDLQAMRQAGAYWLRHDVRWSDIQPNGPNDWYTESLVGLEKQLLFAQDYDMQVILFIHSTPTWARFPEYFKYSCSPIQQEDFTAFGNFLNKLVSSYSSPPYNVLYWELYNEPDIASGGLLPYDSEYGCWGDANDQYFGGGYYADMLQVVYQRIKKANSNAQVLLGGLLLDCNPDSKTGCKTEDEKKPSRFLEGILRHNGANDGGNYFDGVSFHAYDYYIGKLGRFGNPNWDSYWNTTGPVSIAKASFIRSLLTNPLFGAQNKFLINTEAALVCGGSFDPPGEELCGEHEFELTKAYYLIQSYTTAIADNLDGNIWYSALGWRNSGLLYSDYSPRPAYYAYRTLRSELVHAKFSSRITDYSGVSVYEFTRGFKRIWVVWSLDGKNKTITLPSTPSKVIDALGNYLIPVNPIEVTIKPLILEF